MGILLLLLVPVFAYLTYKLMWYPHIAAMKRTNEYGVQVHESPSGMMKSNALEGGARLLGVICLLITVGLIIGGFSLMGG